MRRARACLGVVMAISYVSGVKARRRDKGRRRDLERLQPLLLFVYLTERYERRTRIDCALSHNHKNKVRALRDCRLLPKEA